MKNPKQTEITANEKDTTFAVQLSKRRAPKDIVREARTVSRQLKLSSIIWNIISLLAASYFVYYHVKDVTDLFQASVFAVILLFVLVAIEFAKRIFAVKMFERFYSQEKFVPLAFVLLILVCISLYVSYQGGEKFVVYESAKPELAFNPIRDSLQAEMAVIEDKITEQRKIKWKGKITEEPLQMIKQYEQDKRNIRAELKNLEAADNEENAGVKTEHSEKLKGKGVIFGCIAGAMDLLLILFIGRAEYLENEALLYLRSKGFKLDAHEFRENSFQNFSGALPLDLSANGNGTN